MAGVRGFAAGVLTLIVFQTVVGSRNANERFTGLIGDVAGSDTQPGLVGRVVDAAIPTIRVDHRADHVDDDTRRSLLEQLGDLAGRIPGLVTPYGGLIDLAAAAPAAGTTRPQLLALSGGTP